MFLIVAVLLILPLQIPHFIDKIYKFMCKIRFKAPRREWREEVGIKSKKLLPEIFGGHSSFRHQPSLSLLLLLLEFRVVYSLESQYLR
jgi:hypothetical protein